MSHPVIDLIEELTESYARLYGTGEAGPISELCDRVIKLAEEVPADSGPDAAGQLYRMSNAFLRGGSYRTALALKEKMLEIFRASLGDEHREVLGAMHDVGVTHGRMGNYPAAEKLLVPTYQIARRVLKEEDPLFLDIRGSLGVFYSRTGDFAAAEPLLRRNVEARGAVLGKQHPSYADSLSNLALLYDRMGFYQRSEELYLEAVELARSVSGEESLSYARAIGNLSGTYFEMGNLARAEELDRKALAIVRKTCGDYHPDVALYLGNLGCNYFRSGNLAEALRLHKEELAIREQSLDPYDPSIALTLDNLGDDYSRFGEYDAAEECYIRALRIQQKTLPPYHTQLLLTLTSLGRFYADSLGDMVRAESLLQDALEMRRNSLPEGHPEVVVGMTALAELYCRVGRFSEAESLFRESAASIRNIFGDEHPVLATTLHQLSAIAAIDGRKEEALALAKEATVIDDTFQAHLTTFGSQALRLARVRQAKSTFHSDLSLAALLYGEVTAQWALELVWKRKGVGAEALAVQRETVLAGRYPHLRRQLEALSALQAQIASYLMEGARAADPFVYRETLTRWRSERDELEDKLAREVSEINLRGKLSRATVESVADSLPPESALVEFVRYRVRNFPAIEAQHEELWLPDRYLAFVLPAGRASGLKMIDLGQASAVDAMIAMYRADLLGEPYRDMESSRSRSRDEAATGREPVMRSSLLEYRSLRPRKETGVAKGYWDKGVALRALLFDPLLPYLEGRTRLLIAPDGDLNLLPLEALPTESGGFLVDQYLISYLNVGRDVLRFARQRGGAASAPLVIADPNYDLALSGTAPASGAPFQRLVGTGEEGKSVADLLGVRPFLQDEAVESLLKEAHSPWILHLATHGFFIPAPPAPLGPIWAGKQDEEREDDPVANPLFRSGLALAGANTWVHKGALPVEAQDGLLTAEDVTGLDLQETELAVLSACETGLGEFQVGEGIFGLRRSFVIAGADTLVMSLWKVPDRQTAMLMKRFYCGLLSGEPRADALRHAQLGIKEKHPDPRYWGGFICQGDPRPLAAGPVTSRSEGT